MTNSMIHSLFDLTTEQESSPSLPISECNVLESVCSSSTPFKRGRPKKGEVRPIKPLKVSKKKDAKVGDYRVLNYQKTKRNRKPKPTKPKMPPLPLPTYPLMPFDLEDEPFRVDLDILVNEAVIMGRLEFVDNYLEPLLSKYYGLEAPIYEPSKQLTLVRLLPSHPLGKFISPVSMQALTLIAQSRAQGITQAELTKHLAIDSRSTHHYLKPLMGDVQRTPVAQNKTFTFKLVHRIFLDDSAECAQVAIDSTPNSITYMTSNEMRHLVVSYLSQKQSSERSKTLFEWVINQSKLLDKKTALESIQLVKTFRRAISWLKDQEIIKIEHGLKRGECRIIHMIMDPLQAQRVLQDKKKSTLEKEPNNNRNEVGGVLAKTFTHTHAYAQTSINKAKRIAQLARDIPGFDPTHPIRNLMIHLVNLAGVDGMTLFELRHALRELGVTDKTNKELTIEHMTTDGLIDLKRAYRLQEPIAIDPRLHDAQGKPLKPRYPDSDLVKIIVNQGKERHVCLMNRKHWAEQSTFSSSADQINAAPLQSIVRHRKKMVPPSLTGNARKQVLLDLLHKERFLEVGKPLARRIASILNLKLDIDTKSLRRYVRELLEEGLISGQVQVHPNLESKTVLKVIYGHSIKEDEILEIYANRQKPAQRKRHKHLFQFVPWNRLTDADKKSMLVSVRAENNPQEDSLLLSALEANNSAAISSSYRGGLIPGLMARARHLHRALLNAAYSGKENHHSAPLNGDDLLASSLDSYLNGATEIQTMTAMFITNDTLFKDLPFGLFRQLVGLRGVPMNRHTGSFESMPLDTVTLEHLSDAWKFALCQHIPEHHQTMCYLMEILEAIGAIECNNGQERASTPWRLDAAILNSQTKEHKRKLRKMRKEDLPQLPTCFSLPRQLTIQPDVPGQSTVIIQPEDMWIFLQSKSLEQTNREALPEILTQSFEIVMALAQDPQSWHLRHNMEKAIKSTLRIELLSRWGRVQPSTGTCFIPHSIWSIFEDTTTGLNARLINLIGGEGEMARIALDLGLISQEPLLHAMRQMYDKYTLKDRLRTQKQPRERNQNKNIHEDVSIATLTDNHASPLILVDTEWNSTLIRLVLIGYHLLATHPSFDHRRGILSWRPLADLVAAHHKCSLENLHQEGLNDALKRKVTNHLHSKEGRVQYFDLAHRIQCLLLQKNGVLDGLSLIQMVQIVEPLLSQVTEIELEALEECPYAPLPPFEKCSKATREYLLTSIHLKLVPKRPIPVPEHLRPLVTYTRTQILGAHQLVNLPLETFAFDDSLVQDAVNWMLKVGIISRPSKENTPGQLTLFNNNFTSFTAGPACDWFLYCPSEARTATRNSFLAERHFIQNQFNFPEIDAMTDAEYAKLLRMILAGNYSIALTNTSTKNLEDLLDNDADVDENAIVGCSRANLPKLENEREMIAQGLTLSATKVKHLRDSTLEQQSKTTKIPQLTGMDNDSPGFWRLLWLIRNRLQEDRMVQAGYSFGEMTPLFSIKDIASCLAYLYAIQGISDGSQIIKTQFTRAQIDQKFESTSDKKFRKLIRDSKMLWYESDNDLHEEVVIFYALEYLLDGIQ